MKIAISSDSSLAIRQVEAKERGIFVLPLNVIVDGHEYHDDIDIDLDKLMPMMRKNSRVTTSTPTPFEIEQYFNAIFEKGYDHVIHFTISGALSSMPELFKVQTEQNWPGKVTVIDSRAVCYYMAEHVLTAKEMADAGASVEEIVKVFEARRSCTDIIFIPESLTFLKNGGRISPTVAALGNLIGLIPILGFVDGSIIKIGATRNAKKSITEFLDKLIAENYDPALYNFNIVSFDLKDSTYEYIAKMIHEKLPEFELRHTPLSINVAAHTGPGTFGIGISKKIGVH